MARVNRPVGHGHVRDKLFNNHVGMVLPPGPPPTILREVDCRRGATRHARHRTPPTCPTRRVYLRQGNRSSTFCASNLSGLWITAGMGRSGQDDPGSVRASARRIRPELREICPVSLRLHPEIRLCNLPPFAGGSSPAKTKYQIRSYPDCVGCCQIVCFSGLLCHHLLLFRLSLAHPAWPQAF